MSKNSLKNHSFLKHKTSCSERNFKNLLGGCFWTPSPPPFPGWGGAHRQILLQGAFNLANATVQITIKINSYVWLSRSNLWQINIVSGPSIIFMHITHIIHFFSIIFKIQQTLKYVQCKREQRQNHPLFKYFLAMLIFP